MSIHKLMIGQWAEMTFIVGQTHKEYGKVISIHYNQIDNKVGMDEYKEWRTTEYAYVYEIKCYRDGKEVLINIEPHTPSLVVVYGDDKLTQHAKHLIAKAAQDIETGHHLTMERTKEELSMIQVVSHILECRYAELTEWEREVRQEYLRCTDPDFDEAEGAK